jgi:RNA polymerase sigma-70 factor, ECF subfamily
MGGESRLSGAEAVATTFKGRAQAAQPALIDGDAGIAVAFGGKIRILLRLVFSDGQISEIDAIADPATIAQTQVRVLSG